MFKQLARWLDDRTGWLGWIHSNHETQISGGARWRYVFGPALLTAFLVQAFTGLMMMLSYAPSSSTAWPSVYFINQEMWMGWFLRGVHHFSAQALMVLLPLHLLQVVLARAYRRPREFVWWFGLALLFLAAAFSLTGYLLPWDQKGYWHARVATNIMGSAPYVGPYILKALIGGTDYGNLTVTHFYGLHVGVLPTLFVLCTTAHIVLFRRNGVTPPIGAESRPSATYWPEQAVRNTLFCAGMLGVVITLTLIEGGTSLDAPADASTSDYPARPEWYFLSLFQMLKLFPGKREVIGTFVIPMSIAVALLLLPFLDRLFPVKLAHFLACAFMLTLLGGASFLTIQALRSDANDPLYQAARRKADQARDRAIELARSPEVGIPPDGSAYILRRDPLTQGRAVLEKKCLGCHFLDGKGSGEKQTASDLSHFGSRDWIRGLLANPKATPYFGMVPQCDGMAEWKRTSKLSAEELDHVAEFVASFAKIPADTTPDEWLDSSEVSKHPGLKPFEKECGTCHAIDGFTDGGERDAPKLFAWGSPQWIARMIRKPGAKENYEYLKVENQMPAFGSDQLIQNDVEMVIRYLKEDYLKPSAAPQGH